jgi:hypothetical protein
LLRASEEKEEREEQRNYHHNEQRLLPIPLSVWPWVLERLQKIDIDVPTFQQEDQDDVETDFSHADLLFYMLKGPALLSN